MAQGDFSIGQVIAITSADSFVVTFTTGDRAGSTWTVRAVAVDAYEPRGPDRYLGQSAVAWLRDWLDPAAAEVEVFETGLDQYGRIVADVARTSDGEELTPALTDTSYAETNSLQPGPGPNEVTQVRSQPRTGDGNPDDLIIDTTAP